ncbi:putative ABC transporter ATP-binding protein [bacterium BMS3Bbin04]|nr:putative ABC transporter ATP-binding protein [bacterium BMS3Bbin04]
MSEDKTRSIHEEENLGAVFEPRLVKRLLTYLKPYRLRVFISVFLLLVIAAAEQLGPYLTKVALDDYIVPGDFNGLVLIVVLYFVLYLVLAFARIGQALLTGWVGEKVMYDIRKEVFAHLQRQTLTYFDRNPVGRLVTRATNDVQTLSEIFSSGIVVVFGDVFMLIMIIVAMLLLNWQLAIVAVAVVPFVVWATFFFRRRLRDAFREVRVQTAAVNSFLQEHLSGIRIVQLFTHEKSTARSFAGVNDSLRSGHLWTVNLFSVFFPVLEILSAVAVAMIILRGGNMTLTDAISIGTLIAFLQYVERFFRPIRELAEKWNIFQSGMASAERVFDLLDTEPAIVESSSPISLPALSGHIEFEDVHFSYNDYGEEVLKGIDFIIEPGETIALVGATGAGKTTIINLLGRFYDATSGKVKLDGINVRDLDQDDLHRDLAYVSQDIFLFSGTIRNNIALGDDFTDEQIQNAAERVHADSFIKRLPSGYDEPVTERGGTLSTGQRQLLSFARAMVRDPKVLVLDEATSSVDPETEAHIQDALKVMMKDRTSIIVAHRLSTVQRADKILVMHKGCLREMGTHAELLKKRGIYWRLFELQYKRVA